MSLLELLKELDSLLEGCEKPIYAMDDPSGVFTEYVLDSEKLRAKIQDKILLLENQ